jgi:hypothetical protein
VALDSNPPYLVPVRMESIRSTASLRSGGKA